MCVIGYTINDHIQTIAAHTLCHHAVWRYYADYRRRRRELAFVAITFYYYVVFRCEKLVTCDLTIAIFFLSRSYVPSDGILVSGVKLSLSSLFCLASKLAVLFFHYYHCHCTIVPFDSWYDCRCDHVVCAFLRNVSDYWRSYAVCEVTRQINMNLLKSGWW